MIDEAELPHGMLKDLAEGQDGVVTTAQAARLGVPRTRIQVGGPISPGHGLLHLGAGNPMPVTVPG